MPKIPYRNVLSTAQQKMSASIGQIRASIPHAGETGDLVERVVRSQLAEVLPAKVGVSHGFVTDSDGSVSKQMDIILYDWLNTPRIFTSDGAQMFPVESTYACGEIKTSMDSAQFADTFEKCLSYKRLVRKAYYDSDSAQVSKRTYKFFGDEFEHWQSVYFCVAAQSVSTDILKEKFKNIVEERSLQVNRRVDTLVALQPADGWNMLLNAMMEGNSDIPPNNSINLLPAPGSSICSYRAKEPWSLFVMLLLRYMSQAPTEPINMLPYGGDDPY